MTEDRTIGRMEYAPQGTVTEVVHWLLQHGIDPDQATFTGNVAIKYSSPETDAERERREDFERQRDARHEAWERKEWERLKAKYGDG